MICSIAAARRSMMDIWYMESVVQVKTYGLSRITAVHSVDIFRIIPPKSCSGEEEDTRMKAVWLALLLLFYLGAFVPGATPVTEPAPIRWTG